MGAYVQLLRFSSISMRLGEAYEIYFIKHAICEFVNKYTTPCWDQTQFRLVKVQIERKKSKNETYVLDGKTYGNSISIVTE